MTNYRVYGTTDEITECGQCGKPHLKGTVMMQILDADGNAEAMIYVGSHCAEKLTGVKARRIDQMAETNNMVKADALARAIKTIETLKEMTGGNDRPGKLHQAYAELASPNYPHMDEAEIYQLAVRMVRMHLEVIATNGMSALSVQPR